MNYANKLVSVNKGNKVIICFKLLIQLRTAMHKWPQRNRNFSFIRIPKRGRVCERTYVFISISRSGGLVTRRESQGGSLKFHYLGKEEWGDLGRSGVGWLKKMWWKETWDAVEAAIDLVGKQKRLEGIISEEERSGGWWSDWNVRPGQSKFRENPRHWFYCRLCYVSTPLTCIIGPRTKIYYWSTLWPILWIWERVFLSH